MNSDSFSFVGNLLVNLLLFIQVMSDIRRFLCKKRYHHSDEDNLPHIKTSRSNTDRPDSPGML